MGWERIRKEATAFQLLQYSVAFIAKVGRTIMSVDSYRGRNKQSGHSEYEMRATNCTGSMIYRVRALSSCYRYLDAQSTCIRTAGNLNSPRIQALYAVRFQ